MALWRIPQSSSWRFHRSAPPPWPSLFASPVGTTCMRPISVQGRSCQLVDSTRLSRRCRCRRRWQRVEGGKKGQTECYAPVSWSWRVRRDARRWPTPTSGDRPSAPSCPDVKSRRWGHGNVLNQVVHRNRSARRSTWPAHTRASPHIPCTNTTDGPRPACSAYNVVPFACTSTGCSFVVGRVCEQHATVGGGCHRAFTRCPRSRPDQVVLHGEQSDSRPGGDAHLGVEVLDMGAHRLR
jgi:hypothetical protein